MSYQTLGDYSFYLHIPKKDRVDCPSTVEQNQIIKEIRPSLDRCFDRVVVRWIKNENKNDELMAIQIFGWIASNSPNYLKSLEGKKWTEFYEKPLARVIAILKKHSIKAEGRGWTDAGDFEEIKEKRKVYFPDLIEELRDV